MNRRLWTSVAVTVTVMGGVSFVWGPGRVESGLRWMGRGLSPVLGRLDALPWPAVGAIAAVAAILGGVTLTLQRRRAAGEREPWRTVIELARQGRSPSTIAQRTGLSQDAVRIVLAPIAVDPTFPRGNSFRPSSPTPARRRGSDQSRSGP